VLFLVLLSHLHGATSITSCQVATVGDSVTIDASLVAPDSYVFPRSGQLCVHLEWITSDIWVDKVNITSCGDVGVSFNCSTTPGATDPCVSSTCTIELCNYPELCKFSIATLEESVLLYDTHITLMITSIAAIPLMPWLMLIDRVISSLVANKQRSILHLG
jgi:hypothetical protein